jgi:hypothetical protein
MGNCFMPPVAFADATPEQQANVRFAQACLRHDVRLNAPATLESPIRREIWTAPFTLTLLERDPAFPLSLPRRQQLTMASSLSKAFGEAGKRKRVLKVLQRAPALFWLYSPQDAWVTHLMDLDRIVEVIHQEGFMDESVRGLEAAMPRHDFLGTIALAVVQYVTRLNRFPFPERFMQYVIAAFRRITVLSEEDWIELMSIDTRVLSCLPIESNVAFCRRLLRERDSILNDPEFFLAFTNATLCQAVFAEIETLTPQRVSLVYCPDEVTLLFLAQGWTDVINSLTDPDSVWHPDADGVGIWKLSWSPPSQRIQRIRDMLRVPLPGVELPQAWCDAWMNMHEILQIARRPAEEVHSEPDH